MQSKGKKPPPFIHSYRSATMGSNRDAFLAGYTPKNIPTATENEKARATDQTVTFVGRKERMDGKKEEIPVPKRIPIIPPNPLRIVASIRN